MTTERKDGGPAFPHESYDADAGMDTVKTGMSLRDWFAGQALDAVIGICGIRPEHGPSRIISEEIAGHAYSIADAMLSERQKGGA
jgi:hypothetical protein